jgi:LemA protein
MMKAVLIVLGVIALIVVVVGGCAVSQYNSLVRMDTEVKSKWAQVNVQLQRRADLIPNLVETVKGFATQERSWRGPARSRIRSTPTISCRVR